MPAANFPFDPFASPREDVNADLPACGSCNCHASEPYPDAFPRCIDCHEPVCFDCAVRTRFYGQFRCADCGENAEAAQRVSA